MSKTALNFECPQCNEICPCQAIYKVDDEKDFYPGLDHDIHTGNIQFKRIRVCTNCKFEFATVEIDAKVAFDLGMAEEDHKEELDKYQYVIDEREKEITGLETELAKLKKQLSGYEDKFKKLTSILSPP